MSEQKGKLYWANQYIESLQDEELKEYFDGAGGIYGGQVIRRSANVGPIDGGGIGKIRTIDVGYDPVTNRDIVQHTKDELEKKEKEKNKVCDECGEQPCVCEDEVCENCGKEECECE